MSERRKTISASGEVIPKPYGLGRWHSTRVRPCGHEGCKRPSIVLRPENLSHSVPKTHNCCGEHDVEHMYYCICGDELDDACPEHGGEA